jgi:hypothetical protein
MNEQLTFQLLETELATRVIEHARKKYGYFYEVVGHGPVPEVQYYQGLYRIEPVKVAPAGHGHRVLPVLEVTPIKGLVVIHDPEVVEPIPPAKQDLKIAKPSISEPGKGNEILKAAGIVAGAIALGTLLAVPLLFLSAMQIDPMLICVLPDDTWVCVDAWYD